MQSWSHYTLPESRFLRLVVFFLKRWALPACLLVILPLPVTLNLFADACNFEAPNYKQKFQSTASRSDKKIN